MPKTSPKASPKKGSPKAAPARQKSSLAPEKPEHSLSWAKEMLKDDKKRHDACDQEFKFADVDKSGTLDTNEVVSLVITICTEMHLKIPRAEKVKELVKKVCKTADENSDGVLDLREFRTAFKTMLKACVTESEKEAAEAEAAKASPKTAPKKSGGGDGEAAPKKKVGGDGAQPQSKKAKKVRIPPPAPLGPEEQLKFDSKVKSMRTENPYVAPQLIWECIKNNSSFIRKSPNMPDMSAEKGNLVGKNGFKFSGLANEKAFDIHPVYSGKNGKISITMRTPKAEMTVRPNRLTKERGICKNRKIAMEKLAGMMETGFYRRDLCRLAEKKYDKIRNTFKKNKLVPKSRRAPESE